MNNQQRAGRGRVRLGTAFLAVGLVAAGCAETALPAAEHLEPFTEGATQEEVLAALPDGGILATSSIEEPQIVDGYWMDRYFIEGGYVEVLWVHDTASGYPSAEFRQNLNPVIFRDGILDGWGWEHFDARREEWSISERRPMTEGAANIPPYFPAEDEPRGAPDSVQPAPDPRPTPEDVIAPEAPTVITA